jgi:hypothetical protein
MTTQIVTRSQHSNGSSAHRFGGPNRYMVVLVVPDGVEVPYVLRQSVLAKRGIKYFYIGEYYGEHTGPRSTYARLLARANDVRELEERGPCDWNAKADWRREGEGVPK